MKKRLLWAARSPLRHHDLFRSALLQLNLLLTLCMAGFISQLLALVLNYVQLAFYHRTLVPGTW
jgi:hypothetical protein